MDVQSGPMLLTQNANDPKKPITSFMTPSPNVDVSSTFSLKWKSDCQGGLLEVPTLVSYFNHLDSSPACHGDCASFRSAMRGLVASFNDVPDGTCAHVVWSIG